MDKSDNPLKIGIVGAGFSGMCAAIQLQLQLGIDNYTIFDENHDVGGTWLVNQYPGCACDVASHLYSYSFEPNPYWSKAYSGREEIWEYMRTVAKKHDLYPKIKFHHQIKVVQWSDKINKWEMTVLNKQTGRESKHVFDIMIGGAGALRVPNYPEEFEPFSKEKTHSAEWNHEIDLKGKNVALVGSGASAVQIIPEIVDDVKRLIVYQRNPPFVVPRFQCEFPKAVQWAFAYIPGVQWALRNLIFWSAEMNHSAFKTGTIMSKLSTKLCTWNLNRQIEDPELRKTLTPKYTFGCKRVTPSNDYYPALSKPNVTVITSKITKVTKDTIVNEDGTKEKPDVLILATGYRVQDFYAPMKIYVEGGKDLMEEWKENGPSSYYGITCGMTPNTFFLLGPNTALGHNSVVFSIECQVNWMIEIIREMIKRNSRLMRVKKSAEEEYMNYIMTSMKSTVWGATQCGSWYADAKGRITTVWPESLVSYYNTTTNVNLDHIEFS